MSHNIKAKFSLLFQKKEGHAIKTCAHKRMRCCERAAMTVERAFEKTDCLRYRVNCSAQFPPAMWTVYVRVISEGDPL